MRSPWLPTRPSLLDTANPASPALAPAPEPRPSPFAESGLPQGEPRSENLVMRTGSTADLNRLPQRAHAKLVRLRAAQEDSRIVLQNLAERGAQAGELKRAAQSRLDQAQSTGRAGITRKLTPHELATKPGAQQTVDRLQAEVDAATAENQALSERIDRLRARLSPLPGRLTDWLQSLPPAAVLEEHPPVSTPTLGKMAPAAAVAAQRDRLAELRADLHQVESAPVPSQLVKAQMRMQVADLVRRGQPSVLPAVEIGRPIEFSVHSLPNVATMEGRIELPDALAIACWIDDGAALVARLDREIDELSDDDHALDNATRHQQERELLDAILNCERVEEALIEAAEADGMEISRRDDASPLAVLGVAISRE
jgi:hypothetical protein